MTEDSPAYQAPTLGRADQAFVAALPDFLEAHPNESAWWNNASFSLPLLGCVGFVLLGLLIHKAEAVGFGLFLGAVALFMLPVVLLTWRATATAIVLTSSRALALHNGKVLREVAWADVVRLEVVDTLGNLRWRIVPREGQHLAIEGEIADVEGLLARAKQLAQLDIPGRSA